MMTTPGGRPTLFLLHSLGSSAREWSEVTARLNAEFTCIALDLPGFGDRADDDRTDVEAMVDWLAGEVRSHEPAGWMVVGHSMGGKLATLLAARAEAGEPGLAGLAGVVLIAASPPSPEPMDEERRRTMIGWFAEGAPSDAEAREFVEANTAGDLPAPAMAIALADLRRCRRHAWIAWLERGSREDWSGAAGTIAAPALVIAGGEDEDLGEANQRRLNMPHYRQGEIRVLPDAAHLIPYEQPEALAKLIAEHWAKVSRRALPPSFARVLRSTRVAANTRHVLLQRLNDPAADEPGCLSAGELDVLRAVVLRILPGCREAGDLARRMDVSLAKGEGDGWRFADLPPDEESWGLGLRMLGAVSGGFAALSPARQDEWLSLVAKGDAWPADADGEWSGEQMRMWFEDVRAETVRTWMSHPAAMARIGYDGFANGGDGDRKQGFVSLAADDPEPWQLRPERSAS